MHRSLLAVLVPLLPFAAIATLTAQQEILYYKFEEGGGANVVNYAPATSPAPREGTVVTTDVSAFAPGRFGAGSLRGGGPSTTIYSYMDTGWNGTFTGDFTIAWWMLQRTVPTGAAYVFDLGNVPSTQSSFRMFTGGVAARGLYLRYWGGTPNPLILAYDVQTAAASAWLHVAITVDSTAGNAIWYINGQPNTTIPIAGSGSVVTGLQNLFIGYYSQFMSINNYDLDELRFLNRAAAAAEVLVWSLAGPAADAAFGTGCGLVLGSQGGRPSLGNTNYKLNTTGQPGAGVLGLGSSRAQIGGVPLPFDLGRVLPGLTGCLLHSSAEIQLGWTIGVQPLPIPISNNLSGLTLYGQALLFGGTGWKSSNAFAISLGS